MDIKLDKGLEIDEKQLKDALRLIGKEFIREARLLLNQPDNIDLPHTETGTLARSLKMSVKSRKGDIWLSITAGARYSTALMAGSTRNTKTGQIQVRGRPLFAVVLDRLKNKINQIISEAAALTEN
ncbi:hypothetical protein KBX73_02965 [Acetobacter persici]|uniref:hypothetical protein n=1 Tax=Acetobacter persici TaxID=1076596 RepID=UPI0020CB7E78|nr:hypothetical protein [Acetobacter persici]MCP9318752.1 hypothetical protein [Acetobacter persici]